MSCNIYYSMLLAQLECLGDDYYNMYEQFWSLPDGDKDSLVSDYKKIFDEKKLSKIYIKLVKRGYVRLYKFGENEYIDTSKNVEIILNDINNWRIIDAEEDCYYVVSSGKKHSKIVDFLVNKVHEAKEVRE